jgi:predicted ATP-grasp superfamily ATP-dependent carboligase
MPGIPCSAVFVASGGKSTLLGVARQLVGEKWLGAREFQYCGAIGPWPVADATRGEIRRIGDVLAARFGMMGLFGVDFALDGERVWAIEVNPRYTASTEIIERATGIHALRAHAAACHESTLAAAISDGDHAIHGKAVYFAKRALTILAPITSSATDSSRPSRWPALGDVPPHGTRIAAGRPVVTLFAYGTTRSEVEEKLKDRVAALEQQMYAD